MRPDQRPRFSWMRVTVKQIAKDRPFAICADDNDQEVQVSLAIRVGKGGWPRVGDRWILQRLNDRWVFHAVIGEVAPISIKAPRDSMDAGTEEIFDALIALGLVTEAGGDFVRRED